MKQTKGFVTRKIELGEWEKDNHLDFHSSLNWTKKWSFERLRVHAEWPCVYSEVQHRGSTEV